MTEINPLLSSDPDIIEILLAKVIAMAPSFSQALAQQIDRDVRAESGGQSMYVPKSRKHLTPEQRQLAYQDGLSGMPTEQVTEKHGISRATLYRLMKRGARGRG